MRREVVVGERGFAFFCGIITGIIVQSRDLSPEHSVGVLILILLFSTGRFREMEFRENAIPSVLLGIGFCCGFFALRLGRSPNAPNNLEARLLDLD